MFKKLLGIDQLESRLAQVEKERSDLASELKKIEEERHPKETATAAGEPWVDVVKTTFEDPKNPGAGYFELDWNEPFVKNLIEAGYSGRSDDDIVDMWFNDLCRGVIGDNME
jgi:hypothetical protein